MSVNEIDKIIGMNLNQKRTLRGLSQKDLAEACVPPVRAQQISKFELGLNRIGSSQLVMFAQIIGCSVSDLFAGVEKELPPDDIFTREDMTLIKNYKCLSDTMRDSIRVMVAAMLKELALKDRNL